MFAVCTIALLLIPSSLGKANNPPSKQQQKAEKFNDSNKKKSNTKVISLAESISRSTRLYQDPERAKASREQWRKALEEIKELTLPRGDDKRAKEFSLMHWKMQLDEPSRVELDRETKMTSVVERKRGSSGDGGAERLIPRFEGFASWERMLQDWADDVQEYMDKIDAENAEGYPLSSWGDPGKNQARKETSEPLETSETMPHILSEPKIDLTTPNKGNAPISLPVPAPVREGEAVLPHTDLADKSKRIWIVTTASLPWMTGTAVNPLLRAAHMTVGRKESGGSVTLMIPWLERRKDQEQVYGAEKVFESPEDQEAYIRVWLRDSAKMSQASEDLKIEWYTAWQNKMENSVYSMGDLVAEIPADQVDICILEEPEHLNWYRAPGESWTDKFKHVVGIIHTNYFVYAQEQPAAFIRVRTDDNFHFRFFHYVLGFLTAVSTPPHPPRTSRRRRRCVYYALGCVVPIVTELLSCLVL